MKDENVGAVRAHSVTACRKVIYTKDRQETDRESKDLPYNTWMVVVIFIIYFQWEASTTAVAEIITIIKLSISSVKNRTNRSTIVLDLVVTEKRS